MSREYTYRVAEGTGDRGTLTSGWFGTEAEARGVAEALARSKPGTRFYVLCDVASVIAELPPPQVEWQDG